MKYQFLKWQSIFFLVRKGLLFSITDKTSTKLDTGSVFELPDSVLFFVMSVLLITVLVFCVGFLFSLSSFCVLCLMLSLSLYCPCLYIVLVFISSLSLYCPCLYIVFVFILSFLDCPIEKWFSLPFIITVEWNMYLFEEYFSLKYFGFERTWWRLFQKLVVRTKLDNYVFIVPYIYTICIRQIDNLSKMSTTKNECNSTPRAVMYFITPHYHMI